MDFAAAPKGAINSAAATVFVNVIAGLIAYTFRESKPALNIEVTELALLTA